MYYVSGGHYIVVAMLHGLCQVISGPLWDVCVKGLVELTMFTCCWDSGTEGICFFNSRAYLGRPHLNEGGWWVRSCRQKGCGEITGREWAVSAHPSRSSQNRDIDWYQHIYNKLNPFYVSLQTHKAVYCLFCLWDGKHAKTIWPTAPAQTD